MLQAEASPHGQGVSNLIDFAEYGIDAPREGERLPLESDPHVAVPRFARSLPECLQSREFLEQVEALYPYSFPTVSRDGIKRYIAIRNLARSFLQFKGEVCAPIEHVDG